MISKRRKPRAAWQWRDHSELNPGLRLAVQAVDGTLAGLARALGIAPQAITQWDKIPVKRLLDIERITKVDRAKLRPDLYQRRHTG